MRDKSKNLPDFLIIGAMRSGTSWLRQLLASHPCIYMPDVEVHYFDKHYAKGLGWYREQLQGCSSQQTSHVVVGEKTPKYLRKPCVPGRVRNDIPHAKFIAILRDPVERAISHFKNHRQYNDYEGSFEQFMREHQEAFEIGLYARQIRRWFTYFPREQFRFFIFERVTETPEDMYPQLADFLKVDPEGFNNRQAQKTVNASYMPGLHSIYLLGSRINKFFFRRGWYRTSSFIVQCGQIFKLLRKKETTNASVSERMRRALRERYRTEVDELRQLLGRDIPEWDM